MRYFAIAILMACAAVAQAETNVDIVFLGEVHDNAGHHARQAKRVQELQPAAIVWEMLSVDDAKRVTPALVADQDALQAALDWSGSGWPDFSMYYPIFAAAPSAQHYGAEVSRDQAFGAMQAGLATTFGPDAAEFGLTASLGDEQQRQREALQLAAHCDAMPAEMLPVMVSIQRLRDAQLARVALRAYRDTGGPVAVITGNGHARRDWGAPALLHLAAPELGLHSLGQGELGASAPEGGFDEIGWSDPAARPDPCEAFLKSRNN